MTLLLVGHRGAGKSGLLRRLKDYRPDLETLDLDEAIAQGEGNEVAALFASRGEARFRALERRYLARLARPGRAIALGAGYQGPLPDGAWVLWVRRPTDPCGRIFLDRPRLEPGLDPLAEYRRRFPEREARYRRLADEVLTLEEGFETPGPPEEAFFRGGFRKLGGVLTLLPENLATSKRFRRWLARRRPWGLDAFELRDDLLPPAARALALSHLRPEEVLYSVRRADAPPPEGVRVDWALELGPPPSRAEIVSLHGLRPGETLLDAAARLEAAGRGRLLKFAPEVRTWADLEAGHRWALADPDRRTFLPRSPDGRWAWYRRLAGRRFALAFFREGPGPAPDQPTLLPWARTPRRADAFAAVLGDPVLHSRTPVEQAPFFTRLGLPVLAVRVAREEWDAAFPVLERLGLRYAAVTAPLKEEAARLVRAAQGNINTLLRDPETGVWVGTNTDLPALRQVLALLSPPRETAVWGGGGMLPVLEALLPEAAFYRARSGERRRGPSSPPRFLIWAAGARGGEPPRTWRPELVLDLDYHEASPARAYALAVGARYVSGLDLFRAQAARQRAWWKRRAGPAAGGAV